VGRRFAELLRGPYGRVLRRQGLRVRVTGIATARHGLAIAPRGLDLGRCLRQVRSGGSLDRLHHGTRPATVLDFVARVPADVLLEVTALDPRRGEPAVSHVKAALARGLHVVTANKGPVAFALRPLTALARRKGRRFLYESAVMDGTPIFNLVARCLPGVRLRGFRGTLNSTTSLILSRMEEGLTARGALREAQRRGIAEADPRHDLDGWDSAVKGCALANALLGARVTPAQVRRRGIAAITPKEVRRALRARTRLRLVVRGGREDRRVRVSVGPDPESGSPKGTRSGSGPDAALVLETDLMGEIGVFERGATVDQTAYGLLSDLLEAVRRPRGKRPL